MITVNEDLDGANAGSGSGHLLSSPEGSALLQLEFAAMRISEAFAAWVFQVHAQAGGPDLPFGAIALLHVIRLCGPRPTLAVLRSFTNAHALPQLQKGLRQLQRTQLISVHKVRGRREPSYSLTQSGVEVTTSYALLRERTLVDVSRNEVGLVDAARTASDVLERVVGLYRQAAQRLRDESFLSVSPPGPGPALPRAANERPLPRRSGPTGRVRRAALRRNDGG